MIEEKIIKTITETIGRGTTSTIIELEIINNTNASLKISNLIDKRWITGVTIPTQDIKEFYITLGDILKANNLI